MRCACFLARFLGGAVGSAGSDGFGNLPHGLFAEKVVKVVEEGDDALVAFEQVAALLEAPHILQDVELLPAFAEVDAAVGQRVRIADVHESQVLQDEADVRNARRLRFGQGLPVGSKRGRTVDQGTIFL